MNYPKCYNSFIKWCSTNPTWYNFYSKLGLVELFDVSLRDGLQSLSSKQQLEFTTEKKIQLYKNICLTQKPNQIEVGSIVSEKVLPIFKDTKELIDKIDEFKYNLSFQLDSNATKSQLVDLDLDVDNYVLIPNAKKMEEVRKYNKIKHFSFITSVSNSFQKKNTNFTLEENDADIIKMISMLDKNEKYKIKLYVSCINECPIENKIDNDLIVNRLLKLNKLNVNTICLSDTCGTLHPDDFEYIVDNCNFFGIPFSSFSLHLHVNPNRKHLVQEIIHKALERKINKFDISLLESGGCSVTMKNDKLTPNLSYELYYESLVKYIMKKTNNN